MAEGSIFVEVDSSDGSNCNAQTSRENLLDGTPVCVGSSGEGLPYAPEGWPLPGDIWTWRVGKRKSAAGYHLDRYIYLPRRLQMITNSKPAFYSKVSLKQYLKKEFPEADLEAFFASFTWKIPATETTLGEDVERSSFACEKSTNVDFNGGSKSEPALGRRDCKVGNTMCSLRAKGKNFGPEAGACDICCSEIGFCRDCCCILCCKTVDWEYNGYSFIRCEARVDENLICGHVAHLECALRAYMAGTVGGIIGLDAEYCCRRCDNKTDLLLHVNKLINSCESLDSQDVSEKILNLCLCIVRESERERARDFQNRIAVLMAKLKRGVSPGDIWKKEDNTSALTAGGSGDVHIVGRGVPILGAVENTRKNKCSNFIIETGPSETESIDGGAQRPIYITSDHSNVSVKIADDVDRVLKKLKKSQESEYSLAEQKLCTQKDLLLGLYQQLEAERSELANGSDSDHLLSNVLSRVDQIKHEAAKLQKLMKIADGFGKTPKAILAECLGLRIDD